MGLFPQRQNVSQVDGNAGTTGDPLPAGWYVGVPEELKILDKDWGFGIIAKIRVTEGPLAKRICFDNCITIVHNKSETANDIGQKKLKQWCDATGNDPSSVEGTDPFLGKRIAFRVSVQPANDYYKDGVKKEGKPSNRIEQFKDADSVVAATPVPARPAPVAPAARPSPPHAPAVQAMIDQHTQQTPAAAPAKPKMPWGEKK